ncbi:oxalurate catabolism protein HpxZ [uncultured Leclercia sp.]|uniref:oxalurate catabolism protein HpxZ n=1 Tax=uncultured Leclercia sp. TaxID=332959 RepID=UPI002591398D|nr:oxalurate catabolism protein HpxZ [uncultured Leclercia sp.]
MEINKASTLEEIRQAVDTYNLALVSNDLETVNQLFMRSPDVIRYGQHENLYGYEQIAAFRAARPAGPKPRQVTAVHIVSAGDDFGVANVEFIVPGKAEPGRQTQTWARLPEGWRIIGAHVSYLSQR